MGGIALDTEYYVEQVASKSLITYQKPKNIGGIIEKEKEKPMPVKVAVVKPEWEIDPPMSCMKITQYYHWQHRAIDLIRCKEIVREDGKVVKENGLPVVKMSNNGIFAVDWGVVSFAGWKPGYGYRVEIEHDNGFTSTYSHFSKIYVEKGEKVKRHTLLGIIGTTGRSTGVHLHWELLFDGQKINPLPYIQKYIGG